MSGGLDSCPPKAWTRRRKLFLGVITALLLLLLKLPVKKRRPLCVVPSSLRLLQTPAMAGLRGQESTLPENVNWMRLVPVALGFRNFSGQTSSGPWRFLFRVLCFHHLKLPGWCSWRRRHVALRGPGCQCPPFFRSLAVLDPKRHLKRPSGGLASRRLPSPRG